MCSSCANKTGGSIIHDLQEYVKTWCKENAQEEPVNQDWAELTDGTENCITGVRAKCLVDFVKSQGLTSGGSRVKNIALIRQLLHPTRLNQHSVGRGLATALPTTESVNTILKIKNKVVGYNTDRAGFALTIEELFPESNDGTISTVLQGKSIFILGAGGVTSSIIDALEQGGSKVFLSNRTKKKAEDLKKRYTKIEVLDWGKRPLVCDVVINTTSIGLTKDERIDIDFDDCKGDKNKLFYDLIYNPKETNFLKEARLRENITMNGQQMFLNQAKHAFNLWTKITPEIDDEVIKLLD